MTSVYITVLISAYNYARFIEEAVDSVLAQDFPGDQTEVLVVDDGSTDDTAERVRKYGSRIRYFYKPNGGQASAFNFGVAKARGEVVALLDADDYWLPGKLKRIAEEFCRDPELGMVYHPYLEVDMRTNERRESKMRMISGSLYEDKEKFFSYQAPGTCASFRRRFLQMLLPIPETGMRTQADGYIGLLIPFVAPIAAVPECLAAYRFHGNNLYHGHEGTATEAGRRKVETAEIVIKSVDEWLRRNGYSRLDTFFGRFLLGQEASTFATRPPGRLRFCWFLIRENYVYSVTQKWKLSGICYVTALIALVYGYKRRDKIAKLRCEILEKVVRFGRRVFRGQARSRSNDEAKA